MLQQVTKNNNYFTSHLPKIFQSKLPGQFLAAARSAVYIYACNWRICIY